MARQTQIKQFGTFRPTGVDQTAGANLRALAGLSQQVGEVVFQQAAKQRVKEGKLAGAQAVERDEEGKIISPEFQEDFTLFGQAFNQSSILAHQQQIGMDNKEDLDRIQNEFKFDPDGFKNAVAGRRKGMLTGMPEELSVIVGSDFDSSVSSRLGQINSDMFRRETDQNRAMFQDGLESSTDDLLNATRRGDLDRQKDILLEKNASIDAAVESGLLTATEAVRIKENVVERITQQDTLRQVDEIVFNEDLTLEQQARKGVDFIDNLRKSKLEDLSPEAKDSLINVVSGKIAGLQNQLAKAQSGKNIEDERRISNLKVAAHNDFASPDKLIESIETEFNGGFITGNERTSLLNDVFGGQGRAIKKSQDFSLVAKKLTGNFPEIVLNQDTVNDYYDQVLSPTLSDDPQMRIAQQAQYATVLKAVPLRIKKEIKNNLLSGDAGLIVETVNLIDRLDEVEGLPELAISANQRSFALWVRDLSENMEPEQAVNAARELTDPRDKARIDGRKAELKEKSFGGSIDSNYPDWAEDVFSGFFGGSNLTDDVNSQKVTEEYKTLFEAAYLAGSDIDQAKDQAEKRLKANWKESQFGFMKHPPESFYSVSGENTYIKKQLITDIKKNTLGLEFENEDVFLLSDDITDRQAQGGNPSYRMIVRDKNGQLQPVIMTDPAGKPTNRWMPDKQKEINRQLKDREAEFKRARKGPHQVSQDFLKSIGIGDE